MTLLYLQIAMLVFPFWLKAIWWNVRKLRDAGEPMRRIAMVVVLLALTFVGVIGVTGCGPDVYAQQQQAAYQYQLNDWYQRCNYGEVAACINYQNELTNQRQAVIEYNAMIRANQAAAQEQYDAQQLQWAIKRNYQY